MIRHRQLFFGELGSCFATALASVLDLDLAAVPNFVAFGYGRWFEALGLWCKAQRIHMRIVYDKRSGLVGDDGKPTPMPKHPIIASGQGPRGFRHAVVFQGGRFVHDPHPDASGLLGKPDRYWVFTRCRSKRCKHCDGVRGGKAEKKR